MSIAFPRVDTQKLKARREIDSISSNQLVIHCRYCRRQSWHPSPRRSAQDQLIQIRTSESDFESSGFWVKVSPWLVTRVLTYYISFLCCTPHQNPSELYSLLSPFSLELSHLRETRTWGRLRGLFCVCHHHRVSPSSPSRPRSLHPFLYGSASRVASRRPVQFCILLYASQALNMVTEVQRVRSQGNGARRYARSNRQCMLDDRPRRPSLRAVGTRHLQPVRNIHMNTERLTTVSSIRVIHRRNVDMSSQY